MVYHWTPEKNFASIEHTNLQVPGGQAANVFHQTDQGYYGKGIYCSYHPTMYMYQSYGHGAQCCIMCLCLPGLQYAVPSVQTGRALENGYDSHVNGNGSDGQKGSQWVLFSPDQLLPLFLMKPQELPRCEAVARRLIAEAHVAPALTSTRQRWHAGGTRAVSSPMPGGCRCCACMKETKAQKAATAAMGTKEQEPQKQEDPKGMACSIM